MKPKIFQAEFRSFQKNAGLQEISYAQRFKTNHLKDLLNYIKKKEENTFLYTLIYEISEKSSIEIFNVKFAVKASRIIVPRLSLFILL